MQFNECDDSRLEDFHCFNDYAISWTGDSISAYRSSNVIVKNGIVDGNNANNGICLMYEGSKHGVHGGHIENVEARNC